MEFNEQDLFDDNIRGEEAGREEDASSSDSDSPDDRANGNGRTPAGRAGKEGMSMGAARYAAAESQQSEQSEKLKPKLGTSMPINIRQSPMRAAMKTEERDENSQHANTFVPLHDMDQQPLDLSGRSASISNASVAKREQLLQRNKILRRTGFIESQTQQPGGATGVEPALSDLMDPLRMQPKRMIPIKESHLEPSALSAALGSPSPDLRRAMPASLPRHTQLGF